MPFHAERLSLSLLVLALVPAVARAQTFDGRVDDGAGTPIPSAHVSVNHTARTLTATDGTFTLDTPRDPGGDVLVAASTGFLSAWLPVPAASTTTGLVVPLAALPADDSAFTPESPSVCFECHGSYERGWSRRGGYTGSAHAASALNAHVLDIFRGTASGRTDAASCALVGGSFETVADADGAPVGRCYVGVGLLPDVNTMCGHAGQPRCDDHAAPAASRPTSLSDCAGCHTPGAAIRIPADTDLGSAELDPDNTSVTCAACHRIRDVLDPNRPGVLVGAIAVRGRAAGGLPLGLGPLDDSGADRMRPAYSPLHDTSLLCAPCHQDTYSAPGMVARWPDGVPSEQTYAEWLESPYASGARARDCQSCHMPSLSDLGIVPSLRGIGSGGPDRDPSLNHTHDFPSLTDGAALGRAIAVTVDARQESGELVVDATVTNRGVGHGFPSGVTSRQALLVVTAEVAGRRLVEVAGEVLPLYAGSYAHGHVVSATGATIVVDADVPADSIGRELRLWRTLDTWRDHRSFGVLRALPLAERGLHPTDSQGRFRIVAVRGHEVDVELAGATAMDFAGASFAIGDDRRLAGVAGLGFAKVNVAADGSLNVPFWRATDIQSDNRLAPDETQSTEARFALPPGLDGPVQVTASLVYRKTFIELADQRGWTLDDLSAGQASTVATVMTPAVDAGVADAAPDGGVVGAGGCACSVVGGQRGDGGAALLALALASCLALRRRARLTIARLPLAAAALLALASGCEPPLPPASSYYDEHIAPSLTIGCAAQTAPCHLATSEGTAAGNLDLTSYDSFMRRADVLPAYGPYPVGLLLLKGGPPVEVSVDTFDPPDPTRPDERFVVVRTDIRHAAGDGIRIDAPGYSRLRQWIDEGHTRTGVPRTSMPVATGPCRHGAGSADGFDPTASPRAPSVFADFLANVQPALVARCGAGNCHGSPLADLYVSCGESEPEQRWNYFVTLQHLATPASASEVLRRPLAVLHGGTFHEGGDVYVDTADPDYQQTFRWAEDTIAAHPELLVETGASDGLRFFANRVQPVLVRKGCMFLNCHSGAMFHDLRLRTGSQGAFSRIATRRNYDMSRMMLAPESPDPNASRIIAKNLYAPEVMAGGHGVRHRGGALFEEFGDHGATATDCAGVDADHGDLNVVPAYCVLARWQAIERQAAIALGQVLPDAAPLRGVVWIERPVDTGTPLDFDTYRPGADLVYADATLPPAGTVSLGAAHSLLAACSGLAASTTDVRTPAVSWDGTRIAFAARTSAAEPLRLWWMNADGSACERVPDVSMPTAVDAATGLLLHDFDPAFAPDGRLVFASTRGNLDCVDLSSCGPTRTPAAMAPNANLYVYEPTATTKVRQLTFGLNQEVSPGFLADGRVLMTAEKREDDFHQLAIRRENLDGGDYHPEFAQRPSMGYETALEPAELPNRNLVFVAGHFPNTQGAGTIAVVNRSVGPSEPGRAPTDRFFVQSTRTPFVSGVFRSPSPLPGTHLLAACDLAATGPTAGSYDFDLCDLDPETGVATRIGGAAGRADVEVAAVYGRGDHGVFLSRPDEANGHTSVDPTARDAILDIHDFPMIETLLFSNTRIGRPIDPGIAGFDVIVDLPPPPTSRTFADVTADTRTDAFGTFYSRTHLVGHVPLAPDGSTNLRFRGGEPIRLQATDAAGTPRMFAAGGPFTGPRLQRETMQFYPGERSNQSFRRSLFNGLCGGCHGSISGRELDQVVNIDVLTSASRDASYGTPPTDLYGH